MKATVAYGTKYGSTAKVAEEIASVLRAKGHETTVIDLRRRGRPVVDGCDLLVVGSGIVMGGWSKRALEFLERNRCLLPKRKVALFACCGNVFAEPARAAEFRRLYLEDVARRFGVTDPVSLGLFGGVIDFSRYGFLTKALVNAAWRAPLDGLRGRGVDLSKPYDFRDWGAIRAWADSLDAGVRA